MCCLWQNYFFLSLFDFRLSKKLCLEALKNKCPLGICNIFFLLCMQHSSDTLNLSNLHNFNKSSYGMELEEKIIAKKSQLF